MRKFANRYRDNITRVWPISRIVSLNLIPANIGVNACVMIYTVKLCVSFFLPQQEAKRELSTCLAPEDCLLFPLVEQPNQHT